MKKRYALWTLLMVPALGTALAFLLINALILGSTRDSLYTKIEDVPPAQAALVLGAAVYRNSKVSFFLLDRLESAEELYRAKKVQKIIVSGDHGQPEYNEVSTMRDVLLDRGVPAEDIFMDHAGFDTYDSVYRAKEIFEVENLIIVTQKFHLPRALYIANALDLDAVGLVADRRTYTEEVLLRNVKRESLARVKAFFDVLFRVKPTHLGEKIPITGDGRQTDDR
ncbi:hypothetical protein A2706_01975 [Candidatus Peribacteria bacterium RIFCSPHIGHO2_01_FULL_51_35]|nr:MAG: hypothetical protein A2706_01975 [Candidatus Peribacteria bacterium RIFCSPHIGHO2_01_FULL_51_35]